MKCVRGNGPGTAQTWFPTPPPLLPVVPCFSLYKSERMMGSEKERKRSRRYDDEEESNQTVDMEAGPLQQQGRAAGSCSASPSDDAAAGSAVAGSCSAPLPSNDDAAGSADGNAAVDAGDDGCARESCSSSPPSDADLSARTGGVAAAAVPVPGPTALNAEAAVSSIRTAVCCFIRCIARTTSD